MYIVEFNLWFDFIFQLQKGEGLVKNIDLADLANQRVEGDDGFNSAVMEKSLSDYDNKLGDNRPPAYIVENNFFNLPTDQFNELRKLVKANNGESEKKDKKRYNICCFVLHRFMCATAKLSCHSFEYCYRS